MVKIYAGGGEKPEREEIIEPLEIPTPQRRRERENDPVQVPEREKEPVPA